MNFQYRSGVIDFSILSRSKVSYWNTIVVQYKVENFDLTFFHSVNCLRETTKRYSKFLENLYYSIIDQVSEVHVWQAFLLVLQIPVMLCRDLASYKSV